MTLDIYIDPMSQPSRAVMMLLHECNIQHNVHNIFISKGETRKIEFRNNINIFGKVPAIKDNDFKLST